MEDLQRKGTLTVVSIGEILWDVINGERFSGGAPFNFTCHCQFLGARSIIISAVGQDDAGDGLIQLLEARAMDTNHIQRTADHKTCIVTAISDPHSDTKYEFPKECAWDHISLTDPDRKLLSSASILNFGTLAQRHQTSSAAIQAAAASVPASCTVFLDLNLRKPYDNLKTIKASLEVAQVLKLNEDELHVLRDMLGLSQETRVAIEQLMDQYHFKAIAITKGSAGAVALSPVEYVEIPGIPVKIADTVGSGDAFSAAFILEFVRTGDLGNALYQANIHGAYMATCKGATPLYTKENLAEFRSSIVLP